MVFRFPSRLGRQPLWGRPAQGPLGLRIPEEDFCGLEASRQHACRERRFTGVNHIDGGKGCYRQESCSMLYVHDRFRTVFKTPVTPAVERCGLKPVSAEEQWFAGPIDAQVKNLIAESAICIADLTEPNPNVMYEVALAHSLPSRRSVHHADPRRGSVLGSR